MDADEFDAFYTASFGRVVNQLHAMIGDRDEAQECVQEAFARAWSHRGSLERAAAPEAWVRTTAYRLAVSRWRRVVRGRRAPDRALQPTVHAPPPDPSRAYSLIRYRTPVRAGRSSRLPARRVSSSRRQLLRRLPGQPAAVHEDRLTGDVAAGLAAQH